MLDALTRFIQPVVQIRRSEWRKAILMFLYFAFTISTLYILKPVRNSLFISTHGSENLRYAYVGEGFFLIVITFFYVNLARWFQAKNILFSVAIGFFISNLFYFGSFLKSAGFISSPIFFMFGWLPIRLRL